jgi:hypothetical protein
MGEDDIIYLLLYTLCLEKNGAHGTDEVINIGAIVIRTQCSLRLLGKLFCLCSDPAI